MRFLPVLAFSAAATAVVAMAHGVGAVPEVSSGRQLSHAGYDGDDHGITHGGRGLTHAGVHDEHRTDRSSDKVKERTIRGAAARR